MKEEKQNKKEHMLMKIIIACSISSQVLLHYTLLNYNLRKYKEKKIAEIKTSAKYGCIME